MIAPAAARSGDGAVDGQLVWRWPAHAILARRAGRTLHNSCDETIGAQPNGGLGEARSIAVHASGVRCVSQHARAHACDLGPTRPPLLASLLEDRESDALIQRTPFALRRRRFARLTDSLGERPWLVHLRRCLSACEAQRRGDDKRATRDSQRFSSQEVCTRPSINTGSPNTLMCISRLLVSPPMTVFCSASIMR